MSEPLRYRIWPRDPRAHLYEVSLTIAEPDPDGQVLELPAWIPGSYMIRDYAKHVVGIHAVSNGEPVALTKLDRNSPRDRDDVKFLAEGGLLRRTILLERYENELKPYVLNEKRTTLHLELWLVSSFHLRRARVYFTG